MRPIFHNVPFREIAGTATEVIAMHYTDSKRLDAKMRAIEDALSRIGEPITEAQAKSVAVLEDCECKDGMFALATTGGSSSPARGSSLRLE